jgi:hypothetical protein
MCGHKNTYGFKIQDLNLLGKRIMSYLKNQPGFGHRNMEMDFLQQALRQADSEREQTPNITKQSVGSLPSNCWLMAGCAYSKGFVIFSTVVLTPLSLAGYNLYVHDAI